MGSKSSFSATVIASANMLVNTSSVQRATKCWIISSTAVQLHAYPQLSDMSIVEYC